MSASISGRIIPLNHLPFSVQLPTPAYLLHLARFQPSPAPLLITHYAVYTHHSHLNHHSMTSTP
ncbi:MAG: hypothetical protein ACYDHP_09520 [Ferrimicrobium sp.]